MNMPSRKDQILRHFRAGKFFLASIMLRREVYNARKDRLTWAQRCKFASTLGIWP